MAARGELPNKENNRAGAGWWMDGTGSWRPPEEWPEDTPPFEGWVRNEAGGWDAPLGAGGSSRDVASPAPKATAARGNEKKRLSRQDRADRRAMFTVFGALGAAVILLIVAVFLISQASATGAGDLAAEDEPPEVIFEAEGDQAVLARRRALADQAPQLAAAQLASLEVRSDDDAADLSIDPQNWVVEATDCLDIGEQVLVARSAGAVTFADQLECVVDGGIWADRYFGATIDDVIDVEVEPLGPIDVVAASGGSQWTADTRQAYLTDIAHPATLHIIASDSGHNPRSQDPARWRPSNRNIWCAYAVDWISIKGRWELSVTDAEVVALEDMLASCDEPESSGADPLSTPAGAVAPAAIAFGEGN